ncbi:hypothetical protein IV102_15600 [bacterium]|nr:hypothetical protein [bacterium]
MNQIAIPPVSSPATQQMIDLCQEIAGGKPDLYPQLEAAANQRHSEMTAVSDRFFSEIESQPEDFQKELSKEIELIERLYEGYGRALEAILGFKADPKPESLLEAAMMLSFASNGLLTAMSGYEQRVLSRGSHKLPLVNLLTNLGVALRKGQTSQEAWQATCTQYKDTYQGAIAEIDNSKHKNDKGVPERKAAFEKLLASIARLEILSKESSAANFDEEIATFSQGQDELNAAIATFNEAAVAGPTPSRAVNTVLLSARSLLGGGMHPEVLRGLCQQQLEEIQKALAQAKLAAQTPTSSSTIQEEGARIVESMEAIEEALETLLAFSEASDGKPEVAQEAMKQLEAATLDLHSANNNVQEFNERYGKIVCPSCSTLNVPNNRMCSSCGRQLPQMTGSEEFGSGGASSMEISDAPDGGESGPVMTDVMKRLFDACQEFQSGNLSADEVLAMLDGLDRHIAEARTKIPRFKMPSKTSVRTPKRSPKWWLARWA